MAPGIVEDLLPGAGLTLDHAFDLTSTYEYADAHALATAMLAAGGAAALAGPDREAELGADIVRALSHCRPADGSYALANGGLNGV